jgi:hypothetical protein
MGEKYIDFKENEDPMHLLTIQVFVSLLIKPFSSLFETVILP